MAGLGIDVPQVASQMGRALSRIHHVCGRDGRGVEFVLGGSRDDCWHDCGLWCIDFNRMWPHGSAAGALVAAYVDGAPYLPRPTDFGAACWRAFEAGYVVEAVDVSPAAAALARDFLAGVVRWAHSGSGAEAEAELGEAACATADG